MKTICVITVFATAALAACAPSTRSVERKIDPLLASLNESGAFSGAVIISKGDAILYEGAYGTADGKRPFTLETPADGASIAKTVTSAAIFTLAADDKIGLDDQVKSHVAEFPFDGVTIRQLLSHTAGLPDYDPFEPVPEDGGQVTNSTLQFSMARRAAAPLFEPGSAFAYCNICYDTLALLVERVSGDSYEAFVKARLLDPAGAKDVFLRPARFADWKGERTLGFTSSRKDAGIFDVYDNEGFYGGSNLYFSARDLNAWAAAWAKRGVLPEAARAAALAQARIGSHASALSLSNWYCDESRTRCYFTGHHQGFYNFAYWDESRNLAVAFVSNSTMPPPVQIYLEKALIAFAEGKSAGPVPDFIGADGKEADLAVAEGVYRSKTYGDVRIFQKEDGPYMQRGSGPAYRLYPVGFEMLYSPGTDDCVSFKGGGDAYQAIRIETVFVIEEAERTPS